MQLQFTLRRWQDQRLACAWSQWRQALLQTRRHEDAAFMLKRRLSGWLRKKTRAYMQRWKLWTTQVSVKLCKFLCTFSINTSPSLCFSFAIFQECFYATGFHNMKLVHLFLSCYAHLLHKCASFLDSNCMQRVRQRLVAEISRTQSKLHGLETEHKAQLDSMHRRFEAQFKAMCSIEAQFNSMCTKYGSTPVTFNTPAPQLTLEMGYTQRPTLKQAALKILLRRMVHAKLSHAFTVWSNFRPLSGTSVHFHAKLPGRTTKVRSLLPYKVISDHLCRDTLQAVQSSFASAISDAKTMSE